MHNVQSVPKKVFSFAKYPLAISIGYFMVAVYVMFITAKTSEALDTLAVVTPITIEWEHTEIQDVTVSLETETYDSRPIVEPKHLTRKTITVTDDVIDCTNVLSAVGATRFCYTYMGWQMITNPRSPQYALRQEYFPDWDSVTGSTSAFDEAGFAILNGRYVVATTDADDGGLFHVGDEFTAVLENGENISCIVGEVKSIKDDNWTQYGHLHGDGLCMIEFLVDKEMWYPENHSNPGTNNCMPQWKSPIVKLIKG